MWPLAAPSQPVRASSGYSSNGGEIQRSAAAPWPVSHASTSFSGAPPQLSYGQSYQNLPQQQQQQQSQPQPPQLSTEVTHVAPAPKANGSKTSTTSRGKRRKWSAEERHEHSVIEKKRREVFNVLLLDLARRLPNISGKRRPNKRTVVEGALNHVDAERQLVLDALPDLKALQEERDSLLQEVNEQRLRLGMETRSQRVDTATNIEKLNTVASYAYSAFANGLNGNDNDEGDDPSPPSNSQLHSYTSYSAEQQQQRYQIQPTPAQNPAPLQSSANVPMPIPPTFPQHQDPALLFSGPAGTSQLSPNSFFQGFDFNQFLNSPEFVEQQSPASAGSGSASGSAGPGSGVAPTGTTPTSNHQWSPRTNALFGGNAAAAFEAFTAMYAAQAQVASQGQPVVLRGPAEALSPMSAFLQSHIMNQYANP